MSEYENFKVEVLFGIVKLDSYFALNKEGEIVGMGRAAHYDKDGNITKVIEEPTGLKLIID
jgi:hypothetical protein